MYFECLGSTRHIIQSTRFQVRPMKVGELEKEMSFKASKGIASACDTWLMSLM